MNFPNNTEVLGCHKGKKLQKGLACPKCGYKFVFGTYTNEFCSATLLAACFNCKHEWIIQELVD